MLYRKIPEQVEAYQWHSTDNISNLREWASLQGVNPVLVFGPDPPYGFILGESRREPGGTIYYRAEDGDYFWIKEYKRDGHIWREMYLCRKNQFEENYEPKCSCRED